MPFKIITIPFDNKLKVFNTEILENWTMNKKILSYKVEFVKIYNESFWTIFLEYELPDGIEKFKIDESMSESDKLLMIKLKEWRTEEAKNIGIPSYIIAKNEHFIEIVKKKPKTLQELKMINGIGDKKIKDYGEKILQIVKNFYGD